MNEMMMLGIMVALSIAMILYALMPRKSEEDQEHLLRRMSGKRAHQEGDAGLGGPARASAARQMLEHVTPYAMRPVIPKSDEEMSNLRERLAQAGFRRETSVRYFLASKTLLGILLAVIALIVCGSKGHSFKQVIGYFTVAGAVGFMLPNLWLMLAVSQRKTKIRNGLPDSLDLLVVSVESGLALDASLQRVGDEMHNVHGDLSEELRITTLETQMGVPRSEALENMARRCGLEEMQALVEENRAKVVGRYRLTRRRIQWRTQRRRHIRLDIVPLPRHFFFVQENFGRPIVVHDICVLRCLLFINVQSWNYK